LLTSSAYNNIVSPAEQSFFFRVQKPSRKQKMEKSPAAATFHLELVLEEPCGLLTESSPSSKHNKQKMEKSTMIWMGWRR
jgi:hypothetical protein